MKILEQIKAHKRIEVAQRKTIKSIAELRNTPLYNRTPIDFKACITAKNNRAIIAEFKRQSPSKGIIHPNANITEIVKGYEANGAAALSILNDSQFFGALPTDFANARASVNLPLLQKDFILDEYQIEEAKSIGADAILLIAKMLPIERVKVLTDYAHQLGLQVLLETHTEEEIRCHLHTEFDLIGINNRDLNTFEVNIQHSIALANLLPQQAVKIAESGIQNAATLLELADNGFSGFLMGEYFMKMANPAEQLRLLQQEIKL
ncbi:indole-3-glycerol phosphate synthase TrpC [Myroides odoratimimus]|uniref:indole-3-glycerol phosphate synthase TrpC n=1 Tax=Myroides odoratimimus TaxID=76832 RepID=UPI0004693021|nr:indole-3-glycerol phosphate synthase TrpC [Myroides odoratimimus]